MIYLDPIKALVIVRIYMYKNALDTQLQLPGFYQYYTSYLYAYTPHTILLLFLTSSDLLENKD